MHIYHAPNILTLSPKEKCNNKGTAPVPAAELTPAITRQLPQKVVSTGNQTRPSSVKTYSEAVSALEGTRSEPSKQSKATPKKPKKQFKSPEVVPSEWDRDSNSSAKQDETHSPSAQVTKSVKKVAKKVAESVKVEKIKAKKISQPDNSPSEETDKKKTNKSNDPLPNVDPFKSKEKVSKLIDKDSISHLTFKKVDQHPQNDIGTASVSKPITKRPLATNLVTYILCLELGATTQLWSRPKTLPAPLEEDILLKYPPAHHPLLQAVKLNREYYRKAEKTKDKSMKVVALRAAAGLQKDLSVSINLEEFKNLFQWDPMSEFDEYLNTQKGRRFLKERGTEVTPTPPPEVLMQPPEAERSHAQPHDQPTEHQPQTQMYYHPNGYYYPYQPMNQLPQNQCWPQQGYNQDYSTYQQGYYPPQQWVNNQTAQAEAPIPPPQTRKKESDQTPKSNRSRPNNRKAKGPNWIPPPTLKQAPRDSWEANARERR
ncbi:hypothetical protein PGT21_034197 [Puccinia graminis f. sp. tritici]|uniref:Uncharacterized protein n=1 Tax=Puccinia graminis f. sp. tritici TaxID=56615 RepID=A0A5B0M1H1_PUCGR|nr:hypothetical protein PGT21_034197 [Puccinia graminis f. sp. tritici]